MDNTQKHQHQCDKMFHSRQKFDGQPWTDSERPSGPGAGGREEDGPRAGSSVDSDHTAVAGPAGRTKPSTDNAIARAAARSTRNACQWRPGPYRDGRRASRC
jgi:hypothetical protein